MGPPTHVRAWRPGVEGVDEVLHARYLDHAYPPHTHGTWTVMLLDVGAVRNVLDGRRHDIVRGDVTILPPHVTHDGRAVGRDGFAKRVLYLTHDTIDPALTGAAVDRLRIEDATLRRDMSRLHDALVADAPGLATDSLLAVVRERLQQHLGPRPHAAPGPDPAHAAALRDLLDADVRGGLDLSSTARTLGVSRGHLLRSFTARYGIAPHRYLTGRRLELARRLLLQGWPVAEAAVESGFYDQSHLHRHLVRMVGVPPARFAAHHAMTAAGRVRPHR